MMKRMRYPVRRLLVAAAFVLPFASVHAHAADNFLKPSKEELEMKELPGYPGASSVILTLDEEDNDQLHYKKYYQRIKILSEKGKEKANVEIGYANSTDYDVFAGNADFQVTDIQARTIHADGTIVPFTGKPYTKLITRNADAKYEAKVFTLPDVQVGDIIEYRYAIRMADNWYQSPDWYIQGDTFVKSAHYIWYPTTALFEDGGSNSITWFPILPKGVQVDRRDVHTGSQSHDAPVQLFELSIKDVPPAPDESFMPPTEAYTYRVLFNFTQYRSVQEYWVSVGKTWSKKVDSFSNPNGALRNIAQTITAGATTDEDKLKKLYAAVEALENTEFTREHNKQEDKAAGLGKVNNVADLYEHKRGSSDEMAMLLVGLARAAGMKAYVAIVPDRTHHVFTMGWLNTRQLDDQIAIVQVNGKDVFLDPGSRYTPYGHLAWQHTYVQGIRQAEGGPAFFTTPGDAIMYNRTARVANLTLADDGQASGDVVLTYYGTAAVQWRQRALRGDDESIRRSLRTSLERQLPRTLSVKVKAIDGLADYEMPLKVTYSVQGPIGKATGSRLLVPADIFEANETATFPQEKREVSVYFHFPQIIQDGQGIVLPPSIAVEAVPESSKFGMPKTASYQMVVESKPKQVITHRDYVFGSVIIPVEQYGDLRTFYTQYQGNDHKQIVLKASSALATVTASASEEKSDSSD